MARARTAQRVIEDISRRVELDPATGCWIWQGPLTTAGYGRLDWSGAPSGRRETGAHRVSYSAHIGAIADRMVLDHICGAPACVNPTHLEPVVQRENIMRSKVAMGAINAAKTHCAQGHEFSPENTYVYRQKPPRTSTVRICRTCRRDLRRRARARKAVAP